MRVILWIVSYHVKSKEDEVENGKSPVKVVPVVAEVLFALLDSCSDFIGQEVSNDPCSKAFENEGDIHVQVILVTCIYTFSSKVLPRNLIEVGVCNE